MRLLPLVALVLACGSPPQVADVDDGACAERIDPLRDDDRTPFGLRPNQVRVQLSGPRTGSLDGSSVTVTPSWTGGLAAQVWADPTQLDAPDPAPPLWCRDRTELSAILLLEGDDPRLSALADGVVGRVRAHGPLDALESGFAGSLPGAQASELVPAGQDPDVTTVFVWAYLEDGRVDVRAGPDLHTTQPVLSLTLD